MMTASNLTQALVWPPIDRPIDVPLVIEEPLTIRIQGGDYAVILRTPGDEPAHAAGFCLAEGIVTGAEEIAAIGCCGDGELNVVTVTLTESARNRVTPLLAQRGHISQTSCGWCGRQMIADLVERLTPVPSPAAPVPFASVRQALFELDDHQPLRAVTRATHAAVLYDRTMTPLSWAEDVGRHNAMDKAIGRLLLDKRLSKAELAILSSRISYELVQKAAVARLPILFGMSRPTRLAVHMADTLGITLGCLAPKDRLWIFTHPARLSG